MLNLDAALYIRVPPSFQNRPSRQFARRSPLLQNPRQNSQRTHSDANGMHVPSDRYIETIEYGYVGGCTSPPPNIE